MLSNAIEDRICKCASCASLLSAAPAHSSAGAGQQRHCGVRRVSTTPPPLAPPLPPRLPRRIQPGAASVQVEDWDTGEVLTIQLDPEKGAVQFAEGLYKQVGLGTRGRGGGVRVGRGQAAGRGRAAGERDLRRSDGSRPAAASCPAPARPLSTAWGRPLHDARLQARKQRRAAEQVAPLLAAARGELDYLAEVELMLQQSEGGAHLAALQEVQASAGGCGASKPGPPRAQSPPSVGTAPGRPFVLPCDIRVRLLEARGILPACWAHTADARVCRPTS